MRLAPIIITGNDVLAERVCAELMAGGDVTVTVLSLTLTAERHAAFERAGATVFMRDPDRDDSLSEAGVAGATSILTLSNDDEQNLAVALRARMLNPAIRVVLRQFGTKIGRKIEQNLPNCSVISPAALSASTYAGAALDPGCFFALRFPQADRGAIVGFTAGIASEFGVGGLTVAAAEDALGARVVALVDDPDPQTHDVIRDDDRIVMFGSIVERRTHAAVDSAGQRRWRDLRRLVGRSATALRNANPILRTVALGSIVFFVAMLLFFHFVVRSSWDAAAFDVAQMMTNSGFGDASVTQLGNAPTITVIAAMVCGTVFTAIFIGYVSSAITRAQFTAQQGLRRIRASGHVVIAGAGRIGGAVVDVLTAAGKRVVVVDAHPDPRLIRLAQVGALDLLTGDATHEDVLDLCDIPHAAALIVLTNSDPGNLEIALGARALRPDVPLVVRMENRAFAQATDKLFGIATFSPAALSAPAFVGLAQYVGTIGRVGYGGGEHTILQRHPADGGGPIPAGAVPLCVMRNGAVYIARRDDVVDADETMLLAIPYRPGPPEG